MSRTVQLSDETYARFEADASAAGVSVAQWLTTLANAPDAEANGHAGTGQAPANGGKPRTLAEEFAGRVGLISTARQDRAFEVVP